MAEKDLYATLGVARNADAETIKRAYRKLALKHHPDRNQGNKKAEEVFKAINHANDILGDPRKRALYDEFGEMGLREGFDPDRAREYLRWQSQSGRSGPSLEDLFSQVPGDQPLDFSSIFEQLFQGGGGFPRAGGRGRRTRGGPFGGSSGGRMRAPDLEGELTIDLLQALRGSEMQLNVQGSLINVRIPPGARDGSRLRIRGRGAVVAGAAAGDLVVIVHVRPHPLFWIEGDDLHVRLPVTVSEAWKGARVRVPTAEGDVFVRIPPHTDGGARLRLRGKGLPGTTSHQAGDLIVHVEVVLPPRSADIDEVIEQLEKAYPEDPRADLHL